MLMPFKAMGLQLLGQHDTATKERPRMICECIKATHEADVVALHHGLDGAGVATPNMRNMIYHAYVEAPHSQTNSNVACC
jgi:hypothetical protein